MFPSLPSSFLFTTPATTQFLLLLLLFTSPTPALSSPLSTIAISRISNQTLVCALVLTSTDSRFVLNCTTAAGVVENYPSANSYYYTAVVAGDGFLCGLSNRPSDSNNSMLGWWELVNSTKSIGKRVFYDEPVVKVSAGVSQVCGIVGVDRRLQCWRWEGFSPPNLTNLVDLAVGRGFVCVVDDRASVECYGDSNSDVLGVVGDEPRGNYSVVAAGDRYACVLSTTGRMSCWGIGEPKVDNVDRVYTSLALGEAGVCGLLDDDTLSCWGDRGFDLPESLIGRTFLSVAARGRVFCGVMKTDYKLVCWGGDEFRKNHSTVFDRVLPGSCISTCSYTTAMEGSANLCPSGTAIWEIQAPQSPPTPPKLIVSPPPLIQSQPSPPNSNSDHVKRLIYMVVGAGGLAVVMGLLFCLLFFKYFKGKRWRTEFHDSEQLDTLPSPAGIGMESIKNRDVKIEVETTLDRRLTELISRGHSTVIESFSFRMLDEVTDGFSDEKKIGSGGFGSVYRAVLEDGREVAIKRAARLGSGAASVIRCKEKENAFLAELALLSRVNHRNLVRLVGFCREEFEPELVLIYDYMTNGTLHDHLHNLQPKSPLSSWKSRITVALDAAKGIEYLHRYAVPLIIHRDIKSSNILLDDSWTAKVSDFGLCLINPEENGSVSDRLSTQAAGTVGYMHPEYYRTRCLTTESDVYSFGVVLLELLTGCKAVHHHCGGERSFDGDLQNVVDFAVPFIDSNEVLEVVDPRLPPPSPSEVEAVQLFGYLAADCVRLSGRDRPDMKEVVCSLEVALEKFVG